MVSGKNNFYFADDKEALIAEEAARKKGHPNYFTDVANLKRQISEFAQIENQQYALRRGDFSAGKFVYEMPERFYEWVLIIRKTVDWKPIFDKLSDKYSRTWQEKMI